MDVALGKYPDTFDKYYRARFEHWAKVQADPKEGRWFNQFLPMLCQTCQVPMFFTEPGDPTQICFRESSYLGQKYHFCPTTAKRIFDHEPRKYAQAWLPVQQIYQGSCYPEDINPASPGDSPVREVLRYYGVGGGATTATSPPVRTANTSPTGAAGARARGRPVLRRRRVRTRRHERDHPRPGT